MKIQYFILAIAICLAVPGHARASRGQSQPAAFPSQTLFDLEKSFSGRFGFMAKDLRTGEEGKERPFATSVDWSWFPGGEWARIPLHHAPYPHASRQEGWRYEDKFFPRDPHYIDSSAVIVIPEGFKPQNGAVDLVVHFHGWNNDDLGVLEQFQLPQQLIASRKNAILVLAQGPWHAQDSGGGKMEDAGGFKRMVEEVVDVLRSERRVGEEARLGKVIVSAHSGGYRPAIYAVSRGGIGAQISAVFLFDAFYSLTEELIPWLQADKKHRLRSVYTAHLAEEHEVFKRLLRQKHLPFVEAAMPAKAGRITLEPASECHSCVIFKRFQRWLEGSVLQDIAR